MKNSLKNYKWFEHSHYWLDDETYSKVVKHNNTPISELVEKHKIIKSIRNFIDIINTDDNTSKINVVFAGTEAHTDGSTVTISSDVTDFDLLAGLSLHEASHIKESKDHFRILGKLKSTLDTGTLRYSDDEFRLISEIFKHFKSMNLPYGGPSQYLCLLANFVEDARVDNKVISKYPGYEPYYYAIIRKYILSDEAQARLSSMTSEDWKSYMAQILLLHDPDADLTVLKGLKEIADVIDLNNINRLNGGMDVFRLSFDIFKIIQKYVEQEKATQKQNQKSNQNQQKQSKGSSKGNSSATPNMDDTNESNESEGGSSTGKPKDEPKDENEDEKNESKSGDGEEEDNDESNNGNDKSDDEGEDENESNDNNDSEDGEGDSEDGNEPEPTTEDDFNFSDGSDIMEKIVDALNNEFDKESMDANEANAFDMITNKSVLTRSVMWKGKLTDTILIKDITDEKLLTKFKINGLFSSSNESRSYVEEGIKKGKLLASRLSLMNDVKIVDSIRKQAGRLDERLLPEFGHGNTKIFKTNSTSKFEDTNIHITIDNSGSMRGGEFGEAIQMATMFAVASLYIKGLSVQVSIRSTMSTILGGDTPYVAIIFDSEEHDLRHIKKYMTRLRCTGLTPEGLCFAVIKDYILERSKSKNSFFINVSDGAPSCYANGSDFDGKDAIQFTAEQVSTIIKAGIRVVSFFVGGDETMGYANDFKKMYGKYSYFISVIEPLKVANVFNKNIK